MQGNGTVPIRYGGMQCNASMDKKISITITHIYLSCTYIYAWANRDGGRPMYFIFLLFFVARAHAHRMPYACMDHANYASEGVGGCGVALPLNITKPSRPLEGSGPAYLS